MVVIFWCKESSWLCVGEFWPNGHGRDDVVFVVFKVVLVVVIVVVMMVLIMVKCCDFWK